MSNFPLSGFLSLLAAFFLSQVSFAENPGRLYTIQGAHSQYGPYEGRAWIQGEQIQRNIRFQDHRIGEYQLDIVWAGKLSQGSGGKKAIFPLRISTVLTSVEGFQPEKETFSSPAEISIDLTDLTRIRAEIPGEGRIEEKWEPGEETLIPLWVNQRRVEDATGNFETIFERVGRWLGLDQVVSWYRKQKELDPWRKRPEFIQNKQYVITDHTDAEFYALNPGVLRIANHWINPLSIAEARSRRSAFGISVEEKEARFTQDTLQWNLNEAGLLEIGLRDSNGQKTGSQPNNDAALWTGIFAWSQYLKFQLTQDPATLAVLKKVISGMATLVDISDEPAEFARTLQISPPSEPVTDKWVQGKGSYSHLKWKKGGNNDMLKGVFLTLTLAKDVLDPSEDRALIEKIQRVSKKLPELKTTRKMGDSQGIAHGLRALWLHEKREIDEYVGSVDGFYKSITEWVGADTGFYWAGVSDWSGGHLTSVTKIVEIYLSQALLREFADSPKKHDSLRSVLKRARNALAKMPQIYGGLRRPFIDAVTYLLVPKARKDERLQLRIRADQWALREIPYPRTIGRATADLSLRDDWCISAWPTLPWKGLSAPFILKDDLEFQRFKQGAYSYPLHLGAAWDSDYIWKDNPFPTNFHSNDGAVNLSADYLILYWTLKAAVTAPPTD